MALGFDPMARMCKNALTGELVGAVSAPNRAAAAPAAPAAPVAPAAASNASHFQDGAFNPAPHQRIWVANPGAQALVTCRDVVQLCEYILLVLPCRGSERLAGCATIGRDTCPRCTNRAGHPRPALPRLSPGADRLWPDGANWPAATYYADRAHANDWPYAACGYVLAP